jgi:hypothetical protein
VISIAQKLARLADLFAGNASSTGLPLSNRNYIVDGNFDQWITPTGIALPAGGTTYLAATMFYFGLGQGGAGIASASAFAAGTEPVGMTSPAYNVAWLNVTTATTGAAPVNGSWGPAFSTTCPFMVQHVESVRTLQGRSSTFSFWARTNSTPYTVSTILVGQNFGTGGSPSAATAQALAVSFPIQTTWQRFSVRVDWPSIVGKTIGTNGNDYIQIGVLLPVGVVFDFVTTQWQLEQTSPQAPAAGLPTAFEYRGIGPELSRVQRYYSEIDVIVGTNIMDATNQKTYSLPQFMRATPNLTGVNLNGASFVPYGVDGIRANANAAAFGGGQVIADARL